MPIRRLATSSGKTTAMEASAAAEPPNIVAQKLRNA